MCSSISAQVRKLLTEYEPRRLELSQPRRRLHKIILAEPSALCIKPCCHADNRNRIRYSFRMSHRIYMRTASRENPCRDISNQLTSP